MLKNILYIIFFLSISIAVIHFFNIDEKILSSLNTQNNTEEARQSLPQYTFSERIQRGDAYLRQGFAELARNEYLQAIKKDKSNINSFIKLADTQTLLKNYEGAMQNLYKAESIQNSLEIQKKISENFIHMFDFSSAEKILELQKGKDQEIDYLLDVFLFLKEEIIPEDFQISHIQSFNKSQRVQKAFQEYELYQGGQNIFLQALLVQALIDNTDYELALELLKKVLKQRSDYRDAWIMQGYAYLHLEDFSEAKDSFERAYDLDTTKPETQYFLAVSLEEINQKKKALEMYNLAYKNHYEPKVHVVQKIADLSLEFGYYKEAYKLYEEKLKLSNNDVDSYIQPIWIALSKLSNIDKAENLAEWARKVFPSEAQSYNLSAWVEIERGDYERAQSFLHQSFSFHPNFSAAHYNQGRLYEALNQKDKAIKSYELAYQNDKEGNIGDIAAQSYNRLLGSE
jgi:tetratricopeptide (TPR) repeat protein